MEVNSTIVFIGLIITAITDAIRYLVVSVNGAITIGVAAATGLVISLIDVQLGLVNISPAQGIAAGLAAAGVVSVAKRIGG